MEKDYSFKYLGGTLDDAIGEAYDKVARVIDLPYPGGPRIDKISKEGSHTYKLPSPMNDDSYNFSFSGIKSAVINLVHNERQRGNEINKANLACSFQETVVGIIAKKTMKAIKENNIKQLIVAGGVAANSYLRETLVNLTKENNVELLIPPINYCTDNATMIGCAAYYALNNGKKADLTLNAVPVEKLK